MEGKSGEEIEGGEMEGGREVNGRDELREKVGKMKEIQREGGRDILRKGE